MKKFIFTIAGLTLALALTACSDDNNPSNSLAPSEPEAEFQKVDDTEETTAKLTENDFCRMDSLGRVSQTLNFDYDEVNSQDVEWAQWVRTSKPGEEEAVVGSWSVEDKVLTVADDTGKSAKYNLIFAEEDGILTTMTMIPVEGTDIHGVYEICGARERLAERQELTERQLERIEELHAEHGM